MYCCENDAHEWHNHEYDVEQAHYHFARVAVELEKGKCTDE
jgi:hypothetical protein